MSLARWRLKVGSGDTRDCCKIRLAGECRVRLGGGSRSSRSGDEKRPRLYMY